MDKADHIEREVEENRARVESTLDALKERMSLNQIVDDVAHFVGVEDMRGVMNAASRQVRDNPVALGMIGLGLAWLALGGGSSSSSSSSKGYRSSRLAYRPEDETDSYEPYGGGRPYRSEREGMMSKVKHAVEGAAESVSHAASAATSRVSDTLGHARDRMSGAGHSAYDRAGHWRDDLSQRGEHWREAGAGRGAAFRDRAGRWSDRASDGAHRMARRMEQQPLMIGAAAVMIGAVIGAALPRTRTEDDWIGGTSDRFRDEARSNISEMRERAMLAARETYNATMEAAREEGLMPEKGETLASKVGRVAEAAAHEAKAQVEPMLHGSDRQDEKRADGSGSGSGTHTGSTGSGSGMGAGSSGSSSGLSGSAAGTGSGTGTGTDKKAGLP